MNNASKPQSILSMPIVIDLEWGEVDLSEVREFLGLSKSEDFDGPINSLTFL